MNASLLFGVLIALLLFGVAVGGAFVSTSASTEDCKVSIEKEYSFRGVPVYEGVLQDCGNAFGFSPIGFGVNAAIALKSDQTDFSKAMLLRHEYCHWLNAQTGLFADNAFVGEVECYLASFNPLEYLS